VKLSPYRWKRLVHLEAVVVPVEPPLIVKLLPYRQESELRRSCCLTAGALLRRSCCLTGGNPASSKLLPYRREPYFVEAVALPAGALLRREVLPYRWEPPDLSGGAGLQSGEKKSLSGEGFSPGIYYPAMIRMVGPYFATATSARATCSSISGNITSAICFGPC